MEKGTGLPMVLKIVPTAMFFQNRSAAIVIDKVMQYATETSPVSYRANCILGIALGM